jgi:hypothetical protein
MQQTTEFTDRAEADGVPDGRPEGCGFYLDQPWL